MPVWHEQLLPWRDDESVAVVGITQEQHPQRCRLFAQWKGLDWPILWDPFNLTGSKVVPLHVLIDEHGIVRAVNPKPDALEDFLLAKYAPPSNPVEAREAGARLVEAGRHPSGSFEEVHFEALADLLWRVPGRFDESVEILEAQALERPNDPRYAFRAGVARRLRYDSEAAQPEDFQAAIDHWTRALDADPNQYIWRRRIQQYGPRMDKPYPFYDWVETAQREIVARGEKAIELRVELTPVELAERAEFTAAKDDVEPDAEDRIHQDEEDWISIESAVAFDTSGGSRVASVHLVLRPDADRVHWNNEAGAMQVWIETTEEGWHLDRQLLELDGAPASAVSEEARRFTVEVRLPEDTSGGRLSGYALYYVCEEADGTCLYVRRDFEIEILRP